MHTKRGERRNHQVIAASGRHLRLKLSDMNTSVILREVKAEPPFRIEELGTIHDNFGELHTLAGLNCARDYVYPRIEAQDQAVVGGIQDQVPARKEHLTRGGHRYCWLHRSEMYGASAALGGISKNEAQILGRKAEKKRMCGAVGPELQWRGCVAKMVARARLLMVG